MAISYWEISEMIYLRRISLRLQRYMVILKRVKSARFTITRILVISFFAFTATPKGKTLQLFGQKDAEGIYRPFHIYSMRQAIEEHFILDVLQNYMTYKMYYKIAKIIEDNPEFDTTAGSKAIINYETLHPHNISQKTAIMLEHFMNVTRHKIGGRAKAMVVTPSRLHAVRYVQEFKRQIKEKGLNHLLST